MSGLLIIPYRLTLRPILRWPRLIAHAAFGLYLACLGIWGLSEGMTGHKDPLIIPMAIGMILVGIAIPGSLILKGGIGFRSR